MSYIAITIIHMNYTKPILQNFLLHQEGTKTTLLSQGRNPLPGACSDHDLEKMQTI